MAHHGLPSLLAQEVKGAAWPASGAERDADLILRLSRENPLWSAERIGDTLRLLGYDPPCDDTIRKYMGQPKNQPDKPTNWLPFLRNRLAAISHRWDLKRPPCLV